MAPDRRGSRGALGCGRNGIALLVYIDNDLGGLSHSIERINHYDNVGFILLRVLVFMNVTSFELPLATKFIVCVDATYYMVEQMRARTAWPPQQPA
jgi:hypothetical protein